MTQSTLPTQSATPSHRNTRTRWALWTTLWIIAAGALAALLANDARLDTHFWLSTRWAIGDNDNYRWAKYQAANAPPADATPAMLATRPFYMDDPPPMESKFYRKSAWFWTAVKPMGGFWGVFLALVAIGIFVKDRWRAMFAAVSGLAYGNLATGVLAIIFGRDRPTHQNGANTWEFFRGFTEFIKTGSMRDLAFPSGHATAAFAVAAVIVFFLPKSKWVLVPLAAACAFSRVAIGAHFYGDILAGAVMGWSVTWFVTKVNYDFLSWVRDQGGLGFALYWKRMPLIKSGNALTETSPSGIEAVRPSDAKQR